MKTINTVVCGTGFVGRVHLEAVRRVGFVQLYGICDAVADKAKSLAEEFQCKAFTDIREVVADPAVNAVDICTPNAQHFPMAKTAMEAGKHVICEKPLAISAAQARGLVEMAQAKNLANCTCHNLRYYPMVQHARRMREAGELGEILHVQGTYSQDWLLYDTDWNWRIDSRENGPSRCMADIGSHWCDMIEHITGLRISALCADLQTFHKTRKRPKGAIETFAGKTLKPEDYEEVPIDTEDYGGVILRLGDRARGAFTASQVASGCKNKLYWEVYGTKGGMSWSQERPDELWIGQRNSNNQIIIKDPSLLAPAARSYADLPGGHSEGYDDTFKQVFRRFYKTVADRSAAVEYPQFADGLRQLTILEKELESNATHAWVEV